MYCFQLAREYYAIDLKHPVTNALGYIVPIGRFFFDIEPDVRGNMKKAGTMALWFHTFTNETKYKQVLKLWELAAFE